MSSVFTDLSRFVPMQDAQDARFSARLTQAKQQLQAAGKGAEKAKGGKDPALLRACTDFEAIFICLMKIVLAYALVCNTGNNEMIMAKTNAPIKTTCIRLKRYFLFFKLTPPIFLVSTENRRMLCLIHCTFCIVL